MHRNRRRSEINQSELKSVIAHHSKEEGEEEEGEREGQVCCDDAGEEDDDIQKSLLGSSEDVCEVESHGGRRESNRGQVNDGRSKRTVLHTYSVFISNIGANKKERESSLTHHHSPQSDSETLLSRQCRYNVRDEAIEEPSEEQSDSAVISGDRGEREERRESGERGDIRGEEETRESVGVDEDVKLPWRRKVKRGVKAILMDLRLFLW